MTPAVDAARKAAQARDEMLGARPEIAIPPLPVEIAQVDCGRYFEAAATLYAQATQAYQLRDMTNGLICELWAFQHMQIGLTCQAQTKEP